MLNCLSKFKQHFVIFYSGLPASVHHFDAADENQESACVSLQTTCGV